MRVHRLEVHAFGPFARAESVDFDTLNDAGVFLLCGPTGAGKTSVLDAVCFGLYGQVPGARDAARAFKSHHAAADAVPYVELEVTIRGRRFRIRRQPPWRRGSTRARAGYVDENARVVVEELTESGWGTLTTRLDEAGQLVRRVLGMSRDQFCQVVMLPQGRFETFLRAGAKDRHDVLESLFETQRFQQVERWLSDHRRDCDERLRVQDTAVETLLARAAEVGAVPPDGAADPAEEPARLRLLYDDVGRQLAAATARLDAVSDAAKQAQHALDQARVLADRQQQHADAVRRQHTLDATRDLVDERRACVERARLAAPLLPVLGIVTEAEAEAAVAGAALAGHDADQEHAGPVPVAELERRLERLQESLVRVEALRALAESLADQAQRRDQTQHALASARAEVTTLEQRRVSGPARLAEVRRLLADAAEAVGAVEPARREAEQADEVLAAARRADALRGELARAQDRLSAAVTEHQDRREEWLAVRQRHLDGMAAELAGRLEDGHGCPVCGSTEHPSPAVPTDGHVDAAAESAALRQVQQADTRRRECAEQVARLEVQLGQVGARCGGLDVEAAADALQQARLRVQELESRADGHADLQESAERLEQAHGSVLQQLATAVERRDQLASRHAELDDAAARTQAQLAAGLGTDLDVESRTRRLTAEVADTRRQLEAVRRHEEAVARLEEARSRFDRALADSVFRTRAELTSAAMTDQEIANADALNRAYAAERTALTRQLDDPALTEAAATDPPDLDRLAEEAAAVRSESVAVAARRETLDQRHRRLGVLLDELDEAVAALAPLRRARDLAGSVAGLCNGTSVDNLTKTRLSHYVLAARLEQVVAAANVRLGSIAGGRYQLEHTMVRGVGDTRGGLGLRVLDSYTGQQRDPATLSGGETFYVSLALALGLADLVGQEAGGPELATLFVDEGFGSLDAQTLDEVMDELDALRSGGRCVAVVSHLAELQTRIPTKLRVDRTRHGSSLATEA